MKMVLATAALAGSLLMSTSLSATTGVARVKIGTLSCQEKSGWGFVFGSSHGLHCTFSNGATVEHYDGSISKFGVDIGYQQAAAWGKRFVNAAEEQADFLFAPIMKNAAKGVEVGCGKPAFEEIARLSGEAFAGR